MNITRFISAILCAMLLACSGPGEQPADQRFHINTEKFKLDNGLTVILHVDKSDPVVAVALTAHVGSAREKPGRTGFAHLFEHLLFLDSENLGKGGLDKLSTRVGGSGANGSTSNDWTNYFQTVPSDALEKMLWAEADKLGFFINTVNDQVLAKEKEVVKNEKRQRTDNQPYGHTEYIVRKNLYPADHPYHWDVIGSLEDLQSATLADVKEFYGKWYVPNNVTLSIAGDFDPAQAKEWVNKYFAEIKAGAQIAPVERQPARLGEIKKLFHEDNFARLPELTLTWPGVYEHHTDEFALEILAQYLGEGKSAPLYKVLVDQKQLTANVQVEQYNSELAGRFILAVRAYENTPLDSVHKAIFEALADFEKEGIAAGDLARIQASREVEFYKNVSSVLSKGLQLAQYDIFAGDADLINQYVSKLRAVRREDVMRVYNEYLKDKPFVATSFVPKGQAGLALQGSEKADIVEEAIVQGAEDSFDASVASTYEKTPSSFDRSVEPSYGPTPEIKTPAIWKDSLANGMRVFGIQTAEVPMVQFSIRIDGGLLLENPAKIGVANLLSEVWTKGTKGKTPEEFEVALESLGAEIDVRAGNESITITGSTLARNFSATADLVTEMLLEPRWDEDELLLARQRVISRIKEQSAEPFSIASREFRKIVYGKDHIFSHSILGTEGSVSSLTMADLKQFYSEKLSPGYTSIHVVGDISKEEVADSFSKLTKDWKSREVDWPAYTMAPPPNKPTLYFYDVPGAKQSILYFGSSGPGATDPDYYPAEVVNFILGGGGFASRLMQQVRDEKGYTYGISSRFAGLSNSGYFAVASGVRSNVTLEATALVRQIMLDYGNTYTDADLEVTKSSLTKSNARAFETGNAKLGMLMDISAYNLPDDYVRQRAGMVRELTLAQVRDLSQKYVRPDNMYYLVVGDAATQYERMKTLGLGAPVMIRPDVAETIARK